MPFRIFRTLLYNQSDIDQLHVCTVGLRHKGKIDRCRFFVVAEDSPVLLGMPDIEFLVILKIMCEVVGDQKQKEYNHPVALTAKQTQASRSRQVM